MNGPMEKKIMVRMADGSTRKPLGVVEDVVIRLGDVSVKADFYVMGAIREELRVGDGMVLLDRPLGSPSTCATVMSLLR